MWTYNYNNCELYHHGVKGMKWGVRRYQNKDGSLTPAGKKRMKTFQDAADRAERYSKGALERGKRDRKGSDLTYDEIENELRMMFGTDAKNKQYLKDVFEIDDPHQYIRDRYDAMYKYHHELSDTYKQIAERFRSITPSDIDMHTTKTAKEFLKNERLASNYAEFDPDEGYTYPIKHLRATYVDSMTKEGLDKRRKDFGISIASAAISSALVAIPAFAIIAAMPDKKN